jgi:hypothetical protein
LLKGGNSAPFIKHDVARVEETSGRAMHKAISLLLPGVAKEGADEGLGHKFALLRIWDVHKGMAAKRVELRDIRLVATPGFLRGGLVK